MDFVLLVSGPTCTAEEEHVYSQIRGDHEENATGSREAAEEAVIRHGPGGFDPVNFLSQMDMPALWIFGALDDSIPVRRSTQILDKLIAEGKAFEYHILPNADHILASKAGIPNFDPSYWTITDRWLNIQGIMTNSE